MHEDGTMSVRFSHEITKSSRSHCGNKYEDSTEVEMDNGQTSVLPNKPMVLTAATWPDEDPSGLGRQHIGQSLGSDEEAGDADWAQKLGREQMGQPCRQ